MASSPFSPPVTFLTERDAGIKLISEGVSCYRITFLESWMFLENSTAKLLLTNKYELGLIRTEILWFLVQELPTLLATKAFKDFFSSRHYFRINP